MIFHPVCDVKDAGSYAMRQRRPRLTGVHPVDATARERRGKGGAPRASLSKAARISAATALPAMA
jgi:hypothetical protein